VVEVIPSTWIGRFDSKNLKASTTLDDLNRSDANACAALSGAVTSAKCRDSSRKLVELDMIPASRGIARSDQISESLTGMV
jgi:hypothetical protein